MGREMRKLWDGQSEDEEEKWSNKKVNDWLLGKGSTAEESWEEREQVKVEMNNKRTFEYIGRKNRVKWGSVG